MNHTTTPSSLDPRVRRTRGRITQALSDLLQEKEFAEISITDLTKRADVARVTFYQHFSGKEAVLLTLVSDFFEQLYAALDPGQLEALMAAGDPVDVAGVNPALLPDPVQLHLIHVALRHISSEVRQLAIDSFLKTLKKSTYGEEGAEAHLLATYHVSGVLALLEAQLNGDLEIPPQQMGRVTLTFLRSLLNQMGGEGSIAQALEAGK